MHARSLPCLVAVLLLALTLTARATDLPPAGTVLAESSKDLGFGFREVFRSKVNPPGHFEGVGHFAFVYYRDELLCQCSRTEIAISPDGKCSIFVNSEDGKLMLYRSEGRSRRLLSQDYVGYPAQATWKPAEVVITLVRYENGVTHKDTFNVPL